MRAFVVDYGIALGEGPTCFYGFSQITLFVKYSNRKSYYFCEFAISLKSS
jgi:hypothetical protein